MPTQDGEKPEILKNLELANQVFIAHMQQQAMVQQQQALNLLTLTALGKCAALITGSAAGTTHAEELREMLTVLNEMISSYKQLAIPAPKEHSNA